METKKRALGKGLEQLFNNENLDLDSFEKTVYETATNEEIIEINIDELRPNPYQPRTVFTDEALKEIAKKAIERKTGARGLRSIMENTLMDLMYELPNMKDLKEVIIDKETIVNKEKPTFVFKSE